MESPARQFTDLPHSVAAVIFSRLSPHTISVCTCVCRDWRSQATQQDWARHFSALWQLPPPPPVPPSTAAGGSWQRAYALRQAASRAWLGRPATDKLTGRGLACKACVLLPRQGLFFTGGVDRCVVAWDANSGVQLASSRRHAGTVRCLAADDSLLASGSSDHRIRVWQRSGRSGSMGAAPLLPFDLAGERAVLAGHAGPVSSLQLTPELLVSGSWDCTIRVWDRTSLECTQLLHTDDWVSCLSLRGSLLAAACGKEVLLYRLEAGALHRLASLPCPTLGASSVGSSSSSAGAASAAAVTAVECSPGGLTLFVGTSDGGVWMVDLSCLRPIESGGSAASCCGDSSSSSGVRGAGSGGSSSPQLPRPVLLQQQGAEVSGLSWDHPWLAVADRSGSVVLIDAGVTTAAGAAAVEGSTQAGTAKGSSNRGSKKRLQQQQQQQVRTVRVLHSSGMGGSGAGAAAQCVCLAECWAAAGLDCGTVVTWDARNGLQQQAAAAAARQAKAERRQRNQDRHAAQQQQRRSGGGPMGGSSTSGAGRRSRDAAVAAVAPLPSALQATAGAAAIAAAPGGGTQAPSPAAADGASPPAQPPTLGRSASAGRMRVPPPPRPEVAAAAAAAAASGGSCRHQAWQVLRPAGRAAGSGRAAAGGTSE